ncbi:MAG: hypothetical protein RDU25_03805 [Patescibacteria group bacterium]|nr:hypothetical protein [Patescibacteria group bacterium]
MSDLPVNPAGECPMKKALLAVFVLVVVSGGIYGGVWYSDLPVPSVLKIAEIGSSRIELQRPDSRKAVTEYFTRNGTEELQPSDKKDYYFFADGRQFKVILERGKEGSWCVVGETESPICGVVEGYTFQSSDKLNSYLIYNYGKQGRTADGDHVFYRVSGMLAKIRMAAPSPSVYVYWGKSKVGPYTDTTMPRFVEGKPVYVGWKSKLEEIGAERVTTSAYFFNWNFQDMPIDCGLLQTKAPDAADAEGTYVKVVEPFDAPVCGQNVKIGLERRVVKRVVNGQEQTSETLVYSLNGVRNPIGVVTPTTNANVNVKL